MDQVPAYLNQYAQVIYYLAAFVGAISTVWANHQSTPPPRPKFDLAYLWNGMAGFIMALFAGSIPQLGDGQNAYAAALTGYSVGATLTATSRMIQKRYIDAGARAAAEARKIEGTGDGK